MAEGIEEWTLHDILNFVKVNATLERLDYGKRRKTSWLEGWHPQKLAEKYGLGDLYKFSNVMEVKEEEENEKKLVLTFETADKQLVTRKYNLAPVMKLRDEIITFFRKRGNVHWGDTTDISIPNTHTQLFKPRQPAFEKKKRAPGPSYT